MNSLLLWVMSLYAEVCIRTPFMISTMVRALVLASKIALY